MAIFQVINKGLAQSVCLATPASLLEAPQFAWRMYRHPQHMQAYLTVQNDWLKTSTKPMTMADWPKKE